MSDKKAENLRQLRNIQDMLADVVEKMSDDELLSDLKTEGRDPQKYSERFQSILAQAKSAAGKRKLQMARKAIDSGHQSAQREMVTDIKSARAKVKLLVANDPGAQFMLAARNAAAKDIDSLPDRDVMEMLEMAQLLGKGPTSDGK